MGSIGESSHTPFRLAEKYWKSRASPIPPSLVGQNVLDLSRPEDQADDEVWKAGWWAPPPVENGGGKRKSRKGKEVDRGTREPISLHGAREIKLEDGRKGWVVAEGCVVLPQYLSSETQLELLKSALSEYTLPPNPLSLSTHYLLPPNLFERYAIGDPTPIPPKWESLHEEERSKYAGIPREGRSTIETLPGSVLGYDEILAKNHERGDGAVPSSTVGTRTAGELMRDLRWANLGWVYQWTTKSYDFSPETPIAFPPELARLCREAVGSVPWNEVFDMSTASSGTEQPNEEKGDCASWEGNYVPDTGIVNFYQLKDTLMGHVDRAELDPSRPLVSISLGHSCIFLLGSSSRQDPPRPIVLRSGDILIMSGKSRQSYHGVPRIMEGTLLDHFTPCAGDDGVMRACKRWIEGGRVNINAREVFPPGFKRPRVRP